MKRNDFYHDLYTEGVIERESLLRDEYQNDKSGTAYEMPFGTFKMADDSVEKDQIDTALLLQIKKEVKVIKYVCVGFVLMVAIGIIINIVYLSKIANTFVDLL